jgi:hypothetical protein
MDAWTELQWWEALLPANLAVPRWVCQQVWTQLGLASEDFARIYPLNNHCEPTEAIPVRPYGDTA